MSKRTIQWIAGLVVAGLMVAPGALAWFGDDETSADNLFGAAKLDLILLDLSNAVIAGLVFDEDDFEPDDTKAESLKVKNDGGIDLRYKGLFAKTSGDTALCDALDVEAQLDGGVVYTGPLSGFIVNPAGTLVPGASHTWDFEISLPDAAATLENKTCEFDWVFMGWQTTSDGSWGFTDTEEASNQISTGSWTLAQGAVVINEVMWMGSDVNSNDEWIELRNTTNAAIDVAKWTIDNAKSSGNTLQIIPSSKFVPANGFLLIARSPETSANSALNVSVDVVNGALSLDDIGNGNLILRDRFGNLIDEAKGDDWPAGENGSPPAKKSMERDSVPGDGTSAGSWHTCDVPGCRDDTFWDVDNGDNYGTPGATNLSENDPTSDDYTGPTVAETDEEEVAAAVGDDGDGSEGDDTDNEDTGDTDDQDDGEDTDDGTGNDGSKEGSEEEEEGKENEDTGEADGDDDESTDDAPDPTDGNSDDEEGDSAEEPSVETTNAST